MFCHPLCALNSTSVCGSHFDPFCLFYTLSLFRLIFLYTVAAHFKTSCIDNQILYHNSIIPSTPWSRKCFLYLNWSQLSCSYWPSTNLSSSDRHLDKLTEALTKSYIISYNLSLTCAVFKDTHVHDL